MISYYAKSVIIKMGNTATKSEQQSAQLKQELLLLKSSILCSKEKLSCLNRLNSKGKEIDLENEKLEIQYFKDFLLGLERKKGELDNWKASKFAGKVEKTLKKLLKLNSEIRFKAWKKQVVGVNGSKEKDKVEIEGIFTMDSLEAIDGIDEGNIEINEIESDRKEKVECLSIIDIYRIFEDFTFFKHMQNIKESVRKEQYTRVPEAFKEFLSQTYSKNPLFHPDSVLESLIEHSHKNDLIKLLKELVSCPKSYKFPIQIELLVIDLINSFNKIKIPTEYPPSSPTRTCRMEGGMASLANVLKVLSTLIGSKKLTYRILSKLRPSEIQKTDYLHYLLITLLSNSNLSPEQFYAKLNYVANKDIWCSDVIDAIKFYCSVNVTEEDFQCFFEVFGQSGDSCIGKELILQVLNPKSLKTQPIQIKKVKLLKAVIDVFRDAEQEFLKSALTKFDEQDSETLNLTQFAKLLKKLNKNYDWDQAHSIFLSQKKSVQGQQLISKKSIKKLITNYTISNKTLSKFHKADRERSFQVSSAQSQSLSENFLTGSNTEDLENSLTILIEDLEI